MVGERIKERFDRKPFWRDWDDKVRDDAHELRNRPGGKISDSVPRFRNRNIGGGIGIGLVEAAVSVILSETVGIPFGADADVSSIEETRDGLLYTVNVNAPTQNMAEARAFIDSGTGFTSVLTDTLNVKDTEIVKTRTLRDTYEVTILVKQ